MTEVKGSSSISIDGVKLTAKCPKCGGSNVQYKGGMITPQGMSGVTVTCLDCGHTETTSVKL